MKKKERVPAKIEAQEEKALAKAKAKEKRAKRMDNNVG